MPALRDDHPLHSRTNASGLVRAYRGDRPEITPVWFMRQAGRSLPEYRELRQRTDRPGRNMLDTCLDPALASEITLQPVRRHGVDAAIFFSDIMVPLRLVGVDVTIEPGVGPVMGSAIRTPEDVDRLVALDPAVLDEALEPVREGVRQTVAGLAEIGDGSTPLIGFAGAPFTLAAYLIAGRPSKDHLEARTLMRSHPDAWDRLSRWAGDVTGRFLRAQVEEGASAAQLFDSWAGSLPLEQYREHVAPASRLALDAVRDLTDAAGRRVPLVHFGVGAGELYSAMDLDVDAVGVDWRVPLDVALERIDADVTVQGNLDPAVLGAPWEIVEAAIDHVMMAGSVARAHVFNLGHGVPPTTDPAVLTRIVQAVHAR
ncbi:uroporphyrinogen decarboxylase [Agrococcus beijingensis]|uniref:uroporphyrinogen decarboxylase n=1 Tax=Agrococcus beijingensis TaxID=3068634 RepID=UPI002740959A|nr:uroporphyrinogen decarboxylase [Agrococcus sp. REN33]